jgi:glycosidase
MHHPLLYEVNARHWVAALRRKSGSASVPDLGGVPESQLEALADMGITHLWLMGVWPTGPKSRAEALQHADLRREYGNALPDWSDADVLGSPYAVAALEVSPLLGGDAALARLRERLAKYYIRIILDFVPNHLGLDHAWVRTHPEYFVGQSEPFPDAFEVDTASGRRFLAHGKDPYFPGWTDTVQLDYRRPETREAMAGLLEGIAQKCDGVRCDMAMLLLEDVIRRTWHHVPADFEPARGEFWQAAIGRVKAGRPDFLFLAEAYWDLEGRLCELGFDYAYDKRLYDFVAHDRPWEMQPHLLGLGAANAQRAHFLENHDEPRIAGSIGLELHRAAAVLALGLPGMRFLHEGQLEGARRFARVQLARRAEEPLDAEVARLYAELLPAFRQSAVGRGECVLLTPRRAWEENPTSQCINIVQWQTADGAGECDLVVVNLAPHRAQCLVTLTAHGLAGRQWTLADRIGDERWQRDGAELATKGLYLDLEARGVRLFALRRAG